MESLHLLDIALSLSRIIISDTTGDSVLIKHRLPDQTNTVVFRQSMRIEIWDHN